MMMKTECSCV